MINKKGIPEDQSIRDYIDALSSTTSEEWTKRTKKHLLSVFKKTYKEVPAYQAFIRKQKFSLDVGSSISAFDAVPPVTKKKYLRAYAWEDLCKKNALVKDSLVMTATSGSTGEPFYFPRNSMIDMQSSIYHEMFLRSSKIPKNTSTLIIDCFGMGVWIGGLITYQAFKLISERGFPLTIITPGINKHEIFQAVRNLGPSFDQIILCGYPPFMKDVIDQAKDHGVDWKKYNLKIIFAAESFSETFRDYVVKHTGIKNVYRDTMNIYGSADLGTMAQETPLCILLRRLALASPRLYLRLFKQSVRLPTLAQFIPEFVTFEEKDSSIYCTGDNVLPLVRYEIGDSGAVLTFRDVERICEEEDINLKKECIKVGIKDTITELPFVCVYERSDFSTKLYGAIIYPEYIKKGLQREDFDSRITGKFTMYTRFDEQEDEYLEVNIELKPNVSETEELVTSLVKALSESLTKESAEHKNNTTLLSHGKVMPRVIVWPNEHEDHFKLGGKQKWVKKTV
jgi:phenylacetate-CoA ligase